MLEDNDTHLALLKSAFKKLEDFNWVHVEGELAGCAVAGTGLTVQRIQSEWRVLASLIEPLVAEPTRVKWIYPGSVKSLSDALETLLSSLSSTPNLNSGNTKQDKINNIDERLRQVANTANQLGLNLYFGILAEMKDVSTSIADMKKFVDELKMSEETIDIYRRELDSIKRDLKMVSLTKDFVTRREALKRSKDKFDHALILVAAIAIGWGIYVGVTTSSGAEGLTVLGVKLSAFIPIVGLITYLWRNYLRERHLEEEYAFREALSAYLPASIRTLQRTDNYDPGHEILKQIVMPIDYSRANKDEAFISKRDIRFLTKSVLSSRLKSQ